MNTLNDLEKEFNFSYPEIYKKLYANGMLNWGESSNGWLVNTFPMLKKNPPLLLFGADIEIWHPTECKERILEILNPDFYEINEKFKLIPFAQNGAFDLYVYQYDLQNGEDIPVSFLPHDDCKLQVLAKNLQDFIFRLLLEAVTDIYDEMLFFEVDEDNLKQNLWNQLRTHSPYLTEKQISILEDIYKREIKAYSYKLPNGRDEKAKGLATYDEVGEILKREIDFEYFNQEFDYTA